MGFGRGIIETHLSCAECGCELEVEYESGAPRTKQKSTDSTDITGASKVENRIYVVPCRACMKPAEDIMRALSVLQKQGN